MNEKEQIAKVMGLLGSRKSKAKAEAARRNGKRGGRPRNPKQNNRHVVGLGNGTLGKKLARKQRHDERIAAK